MSSVRIENGTRVCSATIFSVGPEWAAGYCAGHCFDGHIGGKFRVVFPDGTSTEATLLVHAPKDDVAVFRVPSSAVLASSPLPEKLPPSVGRYESVGYPGGKGPYYQQIDVGGNNVRPSPNGFSNRWIFRPHDRARDGHSGSGVFADGMLVGVVSEVDYSDGKTLFCAPHDTLVRIVKDNYKAIGDCGRLLDDPEFTTPREIQIKATPGARYFEYECGPNGCRLKRKPGRSQAPAPPVYGEPRTQRTEGLPPWLQSNITIDRKGQAAPPTAAVPPHHESHPLPRTPRKRSLRIVDCDERIDACEDAIFELQQHRPLKGEKGDAGRDGKDVTPPPQPDVHLPIGLFVVVFATGLAILIVLRGRFAKSKR